MFPHGLPGVALLLLRVAVALTVLLSTSMRGETFTNTWLLVACYTLAILLVLGLLTPVLAVVAIVMQLVSIAGQTGPIAGIIGLSALNALALALLGPGAYSIDAARFGRRVVNLPPADDE